MLSQSSVDELRPKLLALHGVFRVERLDVVLDGGDADEGLGGQRTEALQVADQRLGEGGLGVEGHAVAPRRSPA